MSEIEKGSMWKASDGRLLIVFGASHDGHRIAVRNAATKRLSYIRRYYFDLGRTDKNWWLELHTTPLLEEPK